MIQNLFLNMLEISIMASVIILLMCALSPILEKRYNARWKYYVWLGIAIRLLIPVSFTIPDAPIQINTDQVLQQSENWQASIMPNFIISGDIHNPEGKHESNAADFSLLQISSMVWIIGVCAFSFYNLLNHAYNVRNLSRWLCRVAPEQKELFDKTKTEMSIRKKISLHRCRIISSPLMFGIIRPMILIPHTEYQEIDLYLILKHELMHYKRHDIEVKAVMFAVQTMYWFNPLVYLMSKKMNEAIEMSCDETVISSGDVIYKKRYAETILQSIRQKAGWTGAFTSNYNGGMSSMKKRLQNIIHSGNKKKGLAALTLFMIICLTLSSLVACSSVTPAANVEKTPQTTTPAESVADKSVNQSNTKTQEPSKLFENITSVYAESEPNPELEKLIIDYMQIPDDFLAQTKYYYNYVDLNGDGTDEIFTVVMGPYTSGTGGSTALHVIVAPSGEMNVNQEFTLITTPIIISDKFTKGCREIIVMRSGGGAESEYVVLTASDGQYTSVNDGTVIKSLEDVSGTAIISNDILKDIEEDKALYLQKPNS